MKKLFTLLAFLAITLGAKAEWVTDYAIDYSTHTGFPFYVMGYVPEWVDGVMTDYGADYRYATQADLDGDGDAKWKDGETSVGTVTTESGTEYQKVTGAGPYWHQYFLADGIPTEIDGSYTVKAMVKASEACTITVNMGWNWSGGVVAASVPIGTEWAEVEWEYSGIAGTSCNLVAQPGSTTATIEWKNLTVSHNQKAQKPTVWQEWLTSDGQPVVVESTTAAIPTYMGNAEKPWTDATVRFNDQEKNFLICAWGKENGRNINDDGGHDPFPADIEDDGTGNHVFVVHAKDCTDPTADASAWDNQFWIQSPKNWKEGDQLKIHFRYKASQAVKTNTQVHKQNPSDYKHWQAIGDINFTTEWQEFDKVVAWPSGAGDEGWSIAFNLNPEVKTAVDFYFDDLSWQSMVLEEGYFVASSNTVTGIEYDYDNAVEFVYDKGEDAYYATVGEAGKQDTWVNQVMISTIRGNDAAFKSNTIKPTEAIADGEWIGYETGSLAKINLPAAGVWRIGLAPGESLMIFEKIEGEANKEPLDIKPNPTVVVVHGQERDDLADGQDGTVNEEEGGTGQPWDNQFFLVANRTLSTGEVTVVSFKYKASVDGATSGTQLHGDPGAYMHWNAIGSLTFTNEWQDFSTTLTIPAEANDMRSIAFNMAEIKGACDYELKDFVWKLEDNMETLINETGADNFYVKEGAGTNPHIFGQDEQGIHGVVANGTESNVKYNLAGQRVTNDYQGIVVRKGKKYLVK